MEKKKKKNAYPILPRFLLFSKDAPTSPRPRVLYISSSFLFYFIFSSSSSFKHFHPTWAVPLSARSVPDGSRCFSLSLAKSSAATELENQKETTFGAQVASITRQHDRTLFFFSQLAQKILERKVKKKKKKKK